MSGSGALRAMLALVALGFAVHALPAAQPKPRAWGQRLLAEYQVPAETVARYASFAPTPKSAAQSRQLHLLVADKVAWTGPLQPAGSGRNPYTLVLTVSGVARAAGDVASLWQAGWHVAESPGTHREVTVPIDGIARKAAAAGAPLTLTAAAVPMSFRETRDMSAMVGLVSATNLDIRDVRVQVWSGAAPMAWPDLPLAAATAWLLFGAAALWALRGGRRRPNDTVTLQATVSGSALPTEPAPARAAGSAAPLVASEVVGPAAAPAPPPPVVEEVPPPPDHRSRVADALRQVLTVGLSVRPVPDHKHRPRR